MPGRRAGAPLTLAALATAAGFLSFLPTDYRGVSELGLIAGVGMLIAFAHQHHAAAGAVVQAQSAERAEAARVHLLAPVDEFLERHRIAILIVTVLVVVGGLPRSIWLQFDFNPINLRNPNVGIGRDLSRASRRSRTMRPTTS